MANILDYLIWRGDVPLSVSPFNEVDGLILSEFSYLPMDKVFTGGFSGDIVYPCETATRKELMGRDGLQSVANRTEIRFREFGVECAEIFDRFVFVRCFAGFEQSIPRGVIGTPDGIQLADFTVFSLQIIDEFNLGGLIFWRLQGGDGQ